MPQPEDTVLSGPTLPDVLLEVQHILCGGSALEAGNVLGDNLGALMQERGMDGLGLEEMVEYLVSRSDAPPMSLLQHMVYQVCTVTAWVLLTRELNFTTMKKNKMNNDSLIVCIVYSKKIIENGFLIHLLCTVLSLSLSTEHLLMCLIIPFFIVKTHYLFYKFYTIKSISR